MALSNGQLVEAETLESLRTIKKTSSGEDTKKRYGWSIGWENGHKVVWKVVGQSGVSTVLLLMPEGRFAIPILSNLQRAYTFKLTTEIGEHFYLPGVA